MGDATFASLVLSKVCPRQESRPTATYDPDGDCIEFLARNESFYGQWIDDLVTVYYSRETDEIVGSLITGVSRFQKRMSDKLPGFKTAIRDGHVRLEHVFLAGLWETERDPDSLSVLTYKKLIQMAEDTAATAELCQS